MPLVLGKLQEGEVALEIRGEKTLLVYWAHLRSASIKTMPGEGKKKATQF